MPKYENARVYFIKNCDTNKYYIGSTTQKYLSKRINEHLCQYRNGISQTSSKEIFETNNYMYGVIYECACNNIDDLRTLECQAIQDYIKEGKCVVNVRRNNKI